MPKEETPEPKKPEAPIVTPEAQRVVEEKKAPPVPGPVDIPVGDAEPLIEPVAKPEEEKAPPVPVPKPADICEKEKEPLLEPVTPPEVREEKVPDTP